MGWPQIERHSRLEPESSLTKADYQLDCGEERIATAWPASMQVTRPISLGVRYLGDCEGYAPMIARSHGPWSALEGHQGAWQASSLFEFTSGVEDVVAGIGREDSSEAA